VTILRDGTSTSAQLAALQEHTAALEMEIGTIRMLRRAAEQRVAELERAALHDQLTRILNRDGLADEWARQAPKALLVLDLDRFKAVNDTHGHQLGNRVLTWVARAIDWWLPGRCARLSGDEFAAFVDDGDPLTVAGAVSRAIAQMEIPLPDWHAVTITASVGVAMADGVDDLDDALHRADVAAYCAKRGGRPGQPVLWTPETRMPAGTQRARDGGACPGCGGCTGAAA
jgi:diguanylate cyclase (GGDEF)-like protein